MTQSSLALDKATMRKRSTKMLCAKDVVWRDRAAEPDIESD
jgi:hypothetical protein